MQFQILCHKKQLNNFKEWISILVFINFFCILLWSDIGYQKFHAIKIFFQLHYWHLLYIPHDFKHKKSKVEKLRDWCNVSAIQQSWARRKWLPYLKNFFRWVKKWQNINQIFPFLTIFEAQFYITHSFSVEEFYIRYYRTELIWL